MKELDQRLATSIDENDASKTQSSSKQSFTQSPSASFLKILDLSEQLPEVSYSHNSNQVGKQTEQKIMKKS